MPRNWLNSNFKRPCQVSKLIEVEVCKPALTILKAVSTEIKAFLFKVLLCMHRISARLLKKIQSYFCRTQQPQYGKTKDVRFSIIILFLVYSINQTYFAWTKTVESAFFVHEKGQAQEFVSWESFLILADGVFSM